MSESVYLYDSVSEEIVGEGIRNSDGCVVVQDSELGSIGEFVVIGKDEFYHHEDIQDVVPKGMGRTQVHVECMACGFETVYGVRALIRDSRFEMERNGYPKWHQSCQECGENVWKEIRRQSGTCDWSDTFEWAEAP